MFNTKNLTRWILPVYCLIITLYCVFISFSGNPFSSDDESTDSLKTNNKNRSGLKEIRAGGYRLINPLLDCYELNPARMRNIKQAELKIKDYIATAKQEKNAETISVYFRDLSNGPWMGVNEDSVYSPASLLKVPVLLAALKQAQQNPGYLSQRVVFNPEDVTQFNPNIVGEKHIVLGNSYTIKELMEHMIIYSDNDAQDLLTKNISRENYNDVFLELGIDLSKYAPVDNFMSVKEYASYFRILYNATYLNKDMSEQALTLLSYTKYNNGIVAGVPKGTMVSHKFGERFFPGSNIKQLHDCGIVYKPDRPYLLCIMTRGHDFKEQEEIISTISRIIYNAIN